MKKFVAIMCFLLCSIFTLRATFYGLPMAKNQGLFTTWDDVVSNVVALQPPSVQEFALDEELVKYYLDNIYNFSNARIVEDEESGRRWRVYIVHDIYGNDWDPSLAKGEVTELKDFTGQILYYVDTLLYWDEDHGWLVEFTEFFGFIVQLVRFAIDLVYTMLAVPFEYLFYGLALFRRVFFNLSGELPPIMPT